MAKSNIPLPEANNRQTQSVPIYFETGGNEQIVFSHQIVSVETSRLDYRAPFHPSNLDCAVGCAD